jgi:nicotinamidase-related amidase
VKTQLLIIDPQNDFCDLPETWHPVDPVNAGRTAPALPVPGAHADMQRLATLLRDTGAAFDALTITLDAHHQLDIAHPAFWQQADGTQVLPFTTITAAQLLSGEFLPRDPLARPRCQSYLEALEASGRYQLMVWPVHCEIGSWGHAVHADLRAAYQDWERRQLKTVRKIFKGQNCWTEHYSALQAEVPLPDDPGTQLNAELLASLDQAAMLLVAGEASSHCVKATVEHLAAHLPDLQRIVLLTDCMSPVAGFESQQQQFFAAMQGLGMRLSTSQTIQRELRPA